MIEVHRHHLFPSDQGTRCFTETSPADRKKLRPYGDGVLAVPSLPDGEAERQQTIVLRLNEKTAVRCYSCGVVNVLYFPEYVDVSNDSDPLASYWIPKGSANFAKQCASVLRVYGAMAVDKVLVLMGKDADASDLLKGWTHTQIGADAPIGPNDVWVQGFDRGEDALRILPDGDEALLWRVLFKDASRVAAEAAPFVKDYETDIETLRVRIGHSANLREEAMALGDLMETVFERLSGSKTVSLSKEACAEARRLSNEALAAARRERSAL